jgi:hypothetical protein
MTTFVDVNKEPGYALFGNKYDDAAAFIITMTKTNQTN